MSKKFFIKLLILLSISTALAACAVNPVTGKKELMLVSESRELSIAEQTYPNALWASLGGGGEVRDLRLKAYLKGIVLDIHRSSHRPALPMDFAIQNSSTPNAWAIPGHVVMTRGLLTELGSEAEFAFIMGHEIGHVSARHTARQMTQQILTSAGLLAAGAALGETEYGGAAMTLGAVGSNLLLLKFSRTDELEADMLGVQYMSGLGYDPKNAVKAHLSLERAVEKYLKATGKGSREATFVEELLSTHPRSSERIKEIEGLQAPPASFVLKGDGTGAERFKNMTKGLKRTDEVYRKYYDTAIRALTEKDIEKADGLITAAIRADGNEPPFHVLKGYIALGRKDFKEAEGHFSRALAMDGGYQPARRGMGTLRYLREEYSMAVGTLKGALKIFPGDPSARFFLGMSYYRTGAYAEAIRNLSPYASARPGDPQVHYYLGESYERVGEVGRAYEEYVMQVKVSPGNAEGRLAAARLEVLRRSMEEERRRMQAPPPRQ